MTYKAALEIIFASEQAFHFKYGDDIEALNAAKKMIQEAVEKQIPKEPPNHDRMVCPQCNSKARYGHPDELYCCHCGQKLKITAAGETSPDEYRRLKEKYFGTAESTQSQLHYLKIQKEYADAKLAGIKPFEIRKNDRGFDVGDTVVYAVIDEYGAVLPEHRLSGAVFIIDYITDYAQKDGYVVFTDRLIHMPNA